MHGPMAPAFLLLNFLVLALPVGTVAFFGWLALRFVRAKERANLVEPPGAPRGQLARIEDSLEALQREVQSLQERQTFVEKLLERPREPR